MIRSSMTLDCVWSPSQHAWSVDGGTRQSWRGESHRGRNRRLNCQFWPAHFQVLGWPLIIAKIKLIFQMLDFTFNSASFLISSIFAVIVSVIWSICCWLNSCFTFNPPESCFNPSEMARALRFNPSSNFDRRLTISSPLLMCLSNLVYFLKINLKIFKTNFKSLL